MSSFVIHNYWIVSNFKFQFNAANRIDSLLLNCSLQTANIYTRSEEMARKVGTNDCMMIRYEKAKGNAKAQKRLKICNDGAIDCMKKVDDKIESRGNEWKKKKNYNFNDWKRIKLSSRVENVIGLRQKEKKGYWNKIGWMKKCNFCIYNDFHLNLFPSIDTEA